MQRNIFWGLFVIVFLMSLSSKAFATDQIAESLIYKGEKLELFNTPLEAYFTTQHPRPEFGKLINESCSGEWRGYHGVWEIKDGGLFLLRLQKPCSEVTGSENAPDIFMSVIFPGEKAPMQATWVSGVVHAVYNKRMLELQIDKGKVIREEVKDWPSSKYNYQIGNYEYWQQSKGQ